MRKECFVFRNNFIINQLWALGLIAVFEGGLVLPSTGEIIGSPTEEALTDASVAAVQL